MTDGQADALGCVIWLIAGVTGFIAGVYAANWAIESFDYPRRLVWATVFIVGSGVMTPISFFALLFLAKPFLKKKG